MHTFVPPFYIEKIYRVFTWVTHHVQTTLEILPLWATEIEGKCLVHTMLLQGHVDGVQVEANIAAWTRVIQRISDEGSRDSRGARAAPALAEQGLPLRGRARESAPTGSPAPRHQHFGSN
jgi:hypothetical protein